MFRLFPLKIIIRQHGTNQGVVIKNSDEQIYVTEFDEKGNKVVLPVSTESHFWKNIFSKINSTKFKISVAATFLLIFAAISFIYFSGRGTTEEVLYARYYQTLDDNAIEYFVENTAFAQAKRKYAEGDNSVAWLLITNLNENSNRKTEKVFYEGLILMEMGRHREAIEKFNNLLSAPDNLSIFGVTNWYLGLCYLKTNEVEKARQSFGSLTSDNSLNYKKAQRILYKLES